MRCTAFRRTSLQLHVMSHFPTMSHCGKWPPISTGRAEPEMRQFGRCTYVYGLYTFRVCSSGTFHGTIIRAKSANFSERTRNTNYAAGLIARREKRAVVKGRARRSNLMMMNERRSCRHAAKELALGLRHSLRKLCKCVAKFAILSLRELDGARMGNVAKDAESTKSGATLGPSLHDAVDELASPWSQYCRAQSLAFNVGQQPVSPLWYRSCKRTITL